MDKITIVYTTKDSAVLLSNRRIASKLDKVFPQSINGKFRLKGQLGNLIIKLHYNKLIIDGSLLKFVYGDNCRYVNTSIMLKSIKTLESALGLDLESATVSSMEFGFNLSTVMKPREYFNLLDYSPTCKNCKCYQNGRYFFNSIKKLKFYDKLQESLVRGVNLDLDNSSANWLRYEIEFSCLRKCNPPKWPVYLFDLTSPLIWSWALDQWLFEFLKIQKGRIIRPQKGSVTTVNEFGKFLRVNGIAGIGGVRASLEKSEKLGLNLSARGSNIIYKIQQNLIADYNNPSLTRAHPLAIELENTILAVAAGVSWSGRV